MRCFGLTRQQRRPASGLAGAEEVNSAIDRPNRGNPQGQQRFHLGAIAHKRPNQIEHHTSQISRQAEHRNNQMLERIELLVIVIRHHADKTAQHVQQERTEVRRQRYQQQRIRQRLSIFLIRETFGFGKLSHFSAVTKIRAQRP